MPSALRLLVLGVVVGSNNFAAALALGTLGQARHRWRVVGVFGAFETLFPLLGIWIGHEASERISGGAGWIGIALLAALGAWALLSAARGGDASEELARRVVTWRGLLLLAAGLSLDSLVIGVSLGLSGDESLLVALVFGAFSVAFSWLGIRVGVRARRGWSRGAQSVAGVLLLGLAGAAWAGWV